MSSDVRHLIATLAYRGEVVLSGLSDEVADVRLAAEIRTPGEILAHVNDVLGFAVSRLRGEDDARPETDGWEEETRLYFELLKRLDTIFAGGEVGDEVRRRMIQGPLTDAVLHLGQIGILRRAAGSPVAGRNYFAAEIAVGRFPD